MEGSPATRLPEADSLPDGFVDSSSIDQAHPLSSAPAAGDTPHPALEPDHAAAIATDGETLGATSPPAPAAEETLGASSAASDALQSLTLNAAAEPERALGQPGPAGDTGAVISFTVQGECSNFSGFFHAFRGWTKFHYPCFDVLVADAKESLKECCVVEPVESLTNQKAVNAEMDRESGETKRKVVKRSSKLEKDRELLELAQRYHKVLAERNAAIAVKEKLESLCREFQRQNKMLKEECQRVSTEGQNMRMELSDKFNNVIKDVSVKLEEQKNECIAQLEENNLLRSKLKDLADQYNITQQKYAHQLKEKMLELELADLKMQQHKEKAAQEQTQMQLYADQVSQLIATEKNLRLQLAADGERFQQFQDALSKSNEVFETYKQEMEKMVKLIKELRKENEFLKGKCENSDVALVKLIEERELMKKQIDKFKNQKEKLESLCRSLQAERKQSPSGSIPDATSNQADLTSQGS